MKRSKQRTGRKWVLLGIASFLLFVCSAQAAESPVEIENPGFEEPSLVDERLPGGWKAHFSSAAEGNNIATTGEIKRDESDPYSGNASAYLRTDGPRYAILSQSVKIFPGMKYRLSAWVRFNDSSAAGQISIRLRGRLSDGEMWAFGERAVASGVGDWSEIVVDFTVPENSTDGGSIAIMAVFGKVPLEVWVDDVALVEIQD